MCLTGRVRLGNQDDARRAGQVGQQRSRRLEHRGPVLGLAFERMLNARQFMLFEVLDLQDSVDEHAQSQLGRNPACRNMRTLEKAQKLQVLHDVPDRGGRNALGNAAGQRTGANGFSLVQVGLDEGAEDILSPGIEHVERCDRSVNHDSRYFWSDDTNADRN